MGDKPDGAIIPVTAFTFEAPRVGECSRPTIALHYLPSHGGTSNLKGALMGSTSEISAHCSAEFVDCDRQDYAKGVLV